MDSLVLRQYRSLSKRFSAALERARVRLAVVVNPRVLNEMRLLTKALPANVVECACVRARVQMYSLVLYQSRLQAKGFLAQRTAKVLLGVVLCSWRVCVEFMWHLLRQLMLWRFKLLLLRLLVLNRVDLARNLNVSSWRLNQMSVRWEVSLSWICD